LDLFTYDYLITWTGTTKRIEFVYTATGQKLRKVVTAANSTKTVYDYHNGVEYKNGNLEAIYHAEGRVTKVGSDYSYEYALKDHLGNSRVFFSNRGARVNFIEADDILQESHYYAFGMAYDQYPWGNTTTPNKYQYNGKELNDELGLNWAHHDWRFFDATVGRFWSVDPKAEEEDQETMSPYHFSYNNPIRYSDPDGQCPTCLIGAIIQGGLELGGQLVSNGGDLKQVDWADVGVEAGKGALKGTGIGLIGTVIVEGSGVVVKASFDYTTEKGAENVVNGKKTASAAIIDGALAVFFPLTTFSAPFSVV
jgi:RHS repeat-associated protein